MFNQYLLTLIGQKEEYMKIRKDVRETPLEKSIEFIINLINHDIDKIIKLNQIEYIY